MLYVILIIRPRPVSIFSDYSATTRTEATQTKFCDKFLKLANHKSGSKQ